MLPAGQTTNPVDAVAVPPDCYDKTTMMCRVWVKAEKEYRWVRSIDAREYVFYGAGQWYKPGEEPYSNPVRVPQVAPTMPPAREGSSASAVSSIPMPTYPFAAHNVDELRIFAEAAKIQDYEDLRKDRLVAALISSGYKPPVPG